MAFIVKRDIIAAPTTLPLSTPKIKFTSFPNPSFPFYFDPPQIIDLAPPYIPDTWYGTDFTVCYSIEVNYQTDRWVVTARDTCDFSDQQVAYKIASNTSLPTTGYVTWNGSPLNIIAA